MTHCKDWRRHENKLYIGISALAVVSQAAALMLFKLHRDTRLGAGFSIAALTFTASIAIYLSVHLISSLRTKKNSALPSTVLATPLTPANNTTENSETSSKLTTACITSTIQLILAPFNKSRYGETPDFRAGMLTIAALTLTGSIITWSIRRTLGTVNR